MEQINYPVNLVLLSSRAEAEKILDQMNELCNRYGFATVLDLYELVGMTGTFKDNDYGWFYVRNSEIIFSEGGYEVKLPAPEKINKNAKYTPHISHVDNNSVFNPAHYQSPTGLEVIDVIKAFTWDLQGIEATDTGNIIKYACRWKKKNGIEDLEKIIWYAQHLIDNFNKEKENI